ncbi:MAG TPA: RNA methyltransferase [Vicinamibacterales bacterium]|nr:RNA methyltransferase [Vicinamibacterales bacterium]
MDQITSRQNAVVKRFRALARGREGDEYVLLDGPHLIEEALASGVTIETAAFAESAALGRLASLLERVQRAGARTATAPDAVFHALSPVQHPSGAVAIARFPTASIGSALNRPPQLVVMLEGVQDPGNVGAIIRAAEACGSTGVLVSPGSADPYGWKALRGAMGSSFRLPVATDVSPADAVHAARAAGLRVFAAVPLGGTPLDRCDLRGPAAVLFGGEGAGLPRDVLLQVDERLTIPMQPPVESLNVAVAVALVLYEASRQRSDVAL